MPGGAALEMYVGEPTVHAWDLAVATGQVDRLDPTLAEIDLPPYQLALTSETHRG